MRLTLHQVYKSIKTLPAIELPDFVVLTGVNGAGKTHLLEAIANGSIQIDDVAVDGNNRQIRRFDWSNLIPNDTGAVVPYQLRNRAKISYLFVRQ
jgi:ABC-type cobalamin/Fe3+-siderophores transport system ATPase subunit